MLDFSKHRREITGDVAVCYRVATKMTTFVLYAELLKDTITDKIANNKNKMKRVNIHT